MPVIFLFPANWLLKPVQSNLKQLEEKMKQQKKKEEKMLAEINSVIEILKESPLKIGAKTGTSGKIFGSVTSVQIAVLSVIKKDMKSTVAASISLMK